MKTFKKIILMFVMGSLAFNYSCKKDDTTAGNPGLAVSPSGDQTSTPNSTVQFVVSATSETTSKTALTKFSVIPSNSSGGTITTQQLDSTLPKNTTSFAYTYNFKVPSAATETYTISFKLTDANAHVTTVTRKITVQGTTNGQINSYTVVLLNAPTADKASKTFYATSDNSRYSKGDADGSSGVQGKIDFGYYYLNSDGAVLSSPSSYNSSVYDLSSWSTKNNTMFGTSSLSTSDFDNITDDTQIKTAATSAGSVKSITKNQVIAFKTAAGKMGLIRVTDVTPGYTGSITFDVKVQK